MANIDSTNSEKNSISSFDNTPDKSTKTTKKTTKSSATNPPPSTYIGNRTLSKEINKHIDDPQLTTKFTQEKLESEITNAILDDESLPRQKNILKNKADIDEDGYDFISTEDLSDMPENAFYNNNPQRNFLSFFNNQGKQAYDMFVNTINLSTINDWLNKTYDFVFGEKEIRVFNNLIYYVNNNIPVDKKITDFLLNMDADKMHNLLISQIVANSTNKNTQSKNVVTKLLKIYNALQQQKTENKNIQKLLIRLDDSINSVIEKTLQQIDNLKYEFDLPTLFKEQDLNYKHQCVNLDKAQEQFIKDAIRRPFLNFKLILNGKDFWNTNSTEIQQLHKDLSKKSYTEQLDVGKKIFEICYDKIEQYVLKLGAENKEKLINIILMELTQAGVFFNMHIIHQLQTAMAEKFFFVEENYFFQTTSDYDREIEFTNSNSKIEMLNDVIFLKGFTVKSISSGQEMNSYKPVKITTNLQLDTKALENIKYTKLEASILSDKVKA